MNTEIQALFTELIDTQSGPVGRVVTSERTPAAAHTFHFWAADDSDAARALDIGHIVVAFSEDAAVIGILDEPQRYSDLQTFLDDYFDYQGSEDVAAPLASTRPEILVFACRVLGTKHRRDDVRSRRPPCSGAVFYATPEAIRYAMGDDAYSGVAIPALLHRNGNPARGADGEMLYEETEAGPRPVFQHTPLCVDSDYLLGPEAGHANWTGQSGLATKTSHALFLLASVFKAAQGSVAALMFNVKGPDLLWLDKPAYVSEDEAATLRERDTHLRLPGPLDRHMYAQMQMRPEPFAHPRIFAPFKPGAVPHDDHAKAINLDKPQYLSDLNTLRASARGENDCCHPVLWTLGEVLQYSHRVFEGADLDDKFLSFIGELRDRQTQTMGEFNRLMAEIDDHFAGMDGEKPPQDWHGHHRFTINKARNRIKNLLTKCNGLLAQTHVEYGDHPKCDGPFTDRELRVIDIAGCNTTVQELLVTATINRVWRMAEDGKLGVDKVVIFVDELNKYAPAGGRSGLRDTLVDIAARGRHLNVVLFGAQQFRSKVDDEVVGNAATSFYGRIGDEEIISPSYRSLSESTKAELLRVSKGTMLMRHAHVAVPVFGVFPRPPTLAGASAQKIYGGAARMDTDDEFFRLLQKLSLQYDHTPPTKAQVKSIVGEFVFTDVQRDRLRGSLNTYRPGRSTPLDYFRRIVSQLAPSG